MEGTEGKGLVHIYCGDGKGKTTAAVGLAVRAAGVGRRVIFAQFFKNGSSSEVQMLRLLPGVETMHCKTVSGFYSQMNEAEREQARRDYSRLLGDALAAAREGAGLLILDEAISSCNYGTVSEDALADFLASRPAGLEVVLTGRGPSERLVALADYVTEMKKIKHPYDQGVLARKGIEF